MKTTRTKFISLLMALLFCISILCVPVYALSLPQTSDISDNQLNIDTVIEPLLIEGGSLSEGEYISYKFNVPVEATYTVTLNVRQQSGNGWVLLSLTKSTADHSPLSIDVTSSYQGHVKLRVGTYYLALQAVSCTCTYGAVVS